MRQRDNENLLLKWRVILLDVRRDLSQGEEGEDDCSRRLWQVHYRTLPVR